MIEIRRASNKDKKNILEFFMGALSELDLPFVSGESDADITDIDRIYGQGGLFIILSNGNSSTILGMAALHKITNESCKISKLYVDQKVRGLGFGSLLLNILIGTAKKYGYKEAHLETNRNLSAAVNLFKKMGFVKDKNQLKLPKACDVRLSLELEHVNSISDISFLV